MPRGTDCASLSSEISPQTSPHPQTRRRRRTRTRRTRRRMLPHLATCPASSRPSPAATYSTTVSPQMAAPPRQTRSPPTAQSPGMPRPRSEWFPEQRYSARHARRSGQPPTTSPRSPLLARKQISPEFEGQRSRRSVSPARPRLPMMPAATACCQTPSATRDSCVGGPQGVVASAWTGRSWCVRNGPHLRFSVLLRVQADSARRCWLPRRRHRWCPEWRMRTTRTTPGGSPWPGLVTRPGSSADADLCGVASLEGQAPSASRLSAYPRCGLLREAMYRPRKAAAVRAAGPGASG